MDLLGKLSGATIADLGIGAIVLFNLVLGILSQVSSRSMACDIRELWSKVSNGLTADLTAVREDVAYIKGRSDRQRGSDE